MTIFTPELFRPALDTPLYQQLYTHLRTAILSGELKHGLKLPSSRALASERQRFAQYRRQRLSAIVSRGLS